MPHAAVSAVSRSTTTVGLMLKARSQSSIQLMVLAGANSDVFAEVCDCLQPTPQLQRFFTACDYDMTDLVAARIEQMAQAVFPLVPSSQHALQALQAAMNNERRQQVHPSLVVSAAMCSKQPAVCFSFPAFHSAVEL